METSLVLCKQRSGGLAVLLGTHASACVRFWGQDWVQLQECERLHVLYKRHQTRHLSEFACVLAKQVLSGFASQNARKVLILKY